MLERLRTLVSPPLTTASLVDVVARAHRDRVLLTLERPLPYPGWDTQGLTGAQILDFVARTADVLERRVAVRRGERVAVVATNDADVVLVALAIMRLGAVAVPVDPDTEGLSATLASADIGALVVDRDAWDRVHASDGGALTAALGRAVVMGPVERVPEGAVSLAAALANAMPRAAENIPGSDAAAVFFSPGTSGGAPRGVVLSSEAIALRARRLLLVRLPAATLGVMAVPVAEIMGMFGMFLALASGLPVHLLRSFDPERALDVIADRRATAFFGLPEMYRRMADVGLDRFDLASVRFWISAAERMPTDLIRDFKRRGAMFRWGPLETEAIFIDAYGSVELSGAAVLRFSPPGVSRWDGSFLGFPIPPYRARICDEAGREVRRGEVGELWIQGPGLPDDFTPERPDPAASPQPLSHFVGDGLRNGGAHPSADPSWVRTGDLATQQLGGLVRFVDRMSDVIRTGSHAVYPGELERVLESHPGVDTAVAFGVPHPTKREMPVAVVVPREGAAVGVDELLAWARERLADHKAPRRIWFVSPDDIPRAAHRVRRGALRTRYRDTFA